MQTLADMKPYWESQVGGSVFSPAPVHLRSPPPGPALLPSQSEKWQDHSTELQRLPIAALSGGNTGI